MLLQQRVRRGRLYPWRVIVVCCLLNRTQGTQAGPAIGEVFRRWPDPASLSRAGAGLERTLEPLGLWRRRAGTLRRMSRDYAAGVDAARCSGVGQYARHALDMFVRGVLPRGVVDGHLRRYARWRRRDLRARRAA